MQPNWLFPPNLFKFTENFIFYCAVIATIGNSFYPKLLMLFLLKTSEKNRLTLNTPSTLHS